MQSQKFMWVGRDFFGNVEFGIVNIIIGHMRSPWSSCQIPRPLLWTIEKECRRHLGGLQPLVHRLQDAKQLLPLTVDDSFFT